MRNFIPFLLLTIFFCNCNSKRSAPPDPEKLVPGKQFSSFELSYHGGWEGTLSFLVDSNGIFFFPQLYQSISGSTTKYGLLPDSICSDIDSVIQRIRGIHSQDPDSSYCDDCAEVSIKAVVANDTFRMFQAGEIDGRIWRLIEKLETIRKSKGQELSTAYFYTETMKDVLPPPPPPIIK